MSILKRLGWANRDILNEGLLHSDGLKQRITNLFKRTTLGNSPTYGVGRIAEILRDERGEDYDINEIADEDIIRIANSDAITRGRFSPELRDGIANSRQEDESSMPDIEDSGLPSDSSEDDDDFDDYYEDDLELDRDEEPKEIEIEVESEPSMNDKGDMELNFKGDHDDEDDEDAEEVKTCGCEKQQSPYHKEFAKSNYNKLKHPSEPKVEAENTKLSPKAVNKLLQENYIKSIQHKFNIERKYRNY